EKQEQSQNLQDQAMMGIKKFKGFNVDERVVIYGVCYQSCGGSAAKFCDRRFYSIRGPRLGFWSYSFWFLAFGTCLGQFGLGLSGKLSLLTVLGSYFFILLNAKKFLNAGL